MTEAELKKREAALLEREKRVAEQEKALEEQGISIKKKNWPICMPIMHHDIAGDIPEKSRRVVREAYMCWWVSGTHVHTSMDTKAQKSGSRAHTIRFGLCV